VDPLADTTPSAIRISRRRRLGADMVQRIDSGHRGPRLSRADQARSTGERLQGGLRHADSAVILDPLILDIQGITLPSFVCATTLDLPRNSSTKRGGALGFSQDGHVVLALRELVRRGRLDELKGLLGRVTLDIDVAGSRRDPRDHSDDRCRHLGLGYALRQRDAAEARKLTALLDADEVALPVPVRLELLLGASRRDRPALRRALSGLPLLYPADSTWALMDAWVERAADAHERFGVAIS